ncbi:non-specific lipid-transfer protein 1 [Ricinus communis]|uniref:Non-specific lipid-transfer protein n=1 Tax=Ricinus communis TaxID=3988 RepID=B9T3Q0_RICCO|nr:non-specific lipid-transfer protein 1 [Ricinus communis]EEF29523.1 Nonspecific lipid-transfer protein precursor, putative [Ricinus communis]|eukprot:XP_002532869.1 non-specific lipid-transfer protein 1 [Ricinus communis]
MAGLKLVSLLLLCMVVAPMTTQAITCGQVASSLGPCLNYLKGAGGTAPSAACCNGVRGINSAAKTTADRQTACQCLKSAANGIPGLQPKLAESLPGNCNVNIPYKISLSTNCQSIK